MQFQPGQSGNPGGRPKGTVSGRMQALSELDALLKEKGCLETLRDGLAESLERDPVWFFRRIIMPLLPKEATLQIDNDGVVTWLSLSTTAPTEASSSSTMPATDDSALSVPDDVSEKPSV
ncbi:MAG: DUF5681 domain-containing protein [Kiritimatiellales bacterium]